MSSGIIYSACINIIRPLNIDHINSDRIFYSACIYLNRPLNIDHIMFNKIVYTACIILFCQWILTLLCLIEYLIIYHKQ